MCEPWLSVVIYRNVFCSVIVLVLWDDDAESDHSGIPYVRENAVA